MKKFLWILGVLAAVAVSAFIGMYIYLKATVPDYNGQWQVAAISSNVDIIRDSYGMAHIYAQNDEDAAFAFGFCSAQDRLFQMDMVRRAIRGRLSEVVGRDVIEVDRMYRTITAGKSVEEMYEMASPELMRLTEAYAEGINYYLAHHEEKLPIEFSLLGYEPEPWQPADCMTTLYFMAWALNFAYDSELTLAAFIDRVGRDMADQIFIDYPKGKPVIMPPGWSLSAMQSSLSTISLARRITGTPIRGGSNNWVVSGDKSVTGKPLLANDMHLGMIAPSIWYEVHLHTPTLNVSGACLAGAPLIIAGANSAVAWGFTNVMADDADYYLEKINPDDSTLCEFKGQWEPLDIRWDTISVLGDSVVVFPIRQSRHGIILDDIIDSTVRGDTAYSIAMRWTISDFGREAEAIYRLNRASSVDDIEKAVADYKCPGQNWVYADTAGNIGFWAAVGIPRREGFDGQDLLAGWDGEHEWNGYLPTEEQPHVRNPERGWMASANNKHCGDDYPYYITHCYAPSERFERIQKLLTEKDKLGIDDFKRMQGDTYLLVGERWSPIIIAAVSAANPTEREQKALKYLKDWDFYSPPDDIASTIFHATWQYMIDNMFRERLGDSLFYFFLSENSFTVHKAMQNLIDQPNSPWYDAPETEGVENRDSVIAKSFGQALDYLDDKMGGSMSNWQWGDLHTLTIFHPIGRVLPLFGGMMNIGPYPVGGGSHSINPSLYRLSNPWAMVAGASQRHIFDLSDIDNSLRIIPTGISGNFMSPHYKDQAEKWLNVDYRPFVLGREKVEADAAYRMTFIAGPDSTIDTKP